MQITRIQESTCKILHVQQTTMAQSMEHSLDNPNPTMWAFYEYVIVGGSHEMRRLKQIPEPQRKLLVMKNMSTLIRRIPKDYDELRELHFKQIRRHNTGLLFGDLQTPQKHHNDKTQKHKLRIKKYTKEFKHMLATAHFLTKFAKKTYPINEPVKLMGIQLNELVRVYRSQLHHIPILWGQSDVKVDDHYEQIFLTLAPKDQQEFASLLDQAMLDTLHHMEANPMDAQIFEVGLIRALDSLKSIARGPNLSVGTKKYIDFLIRALGQLIHPHPHLAKKYADDFYRLHNASQ